jgi:hypothetical protein
MLSILSASLNRQLIHEQVSRPIHKHVAFPSVSFLFPTPEVTENTQRYYELQSVHLPVRTVATAVKAVCKYCGRVLNVIRIFVTSSFSYVKYKLPRFTVIS